MKIATVFLVAVTVFTSLFLESSAAPNALFAGIASKTGSLINKVADFTENTIVAAGKATDEVVKGIGNVIIGKATKDIELVKEGSAKLVDGVEDTLNKVTGVVATLGGKLGEKLKEALIKLKIAIKELIEIVKKILEAIAEGANDTIKKLDGFLKDEISKLKAIIAEVKEILEKLSKKAGNDVSIVIRAVKDILVKVDEDVKNLVSIVAEAQKSKTTEVTDGAEEAPKKLAENSADDQTMSNRISQSNKALDETIDTVKKELDKKTGDDKSKLPLTDALDWLLNQLRPKVNDIHDQLRKAKQWSSEERKAMSSKLRTTIDNIQETMASFSGLDDSVKAVMSENIGVMLQNADEVAKELSA